MGLSSDSSEMPTYWNWTTTIGGWYGGIEDNSHKSKNWFANDDYSDLYYEKMLWADTYLIGCGAIVLDTSDENNLFTVVFNYICNYAPGNKYNETLYEEGKPASNCPEDSKPSKNYPSLCELNKLVLY